MLVSFYAIPLSFLLITPPPKIKIQNHIFVTKNPNTHLSRPICIEQQSKTQLYCNVHSVEQKSIGLKFCQVLNWNPFRHTNIHIAFRSSNNRVGTLIVATIYLQVIQNRYMIRSFTVLQCSHQHCVQPVASDVEVVRYL